MNLALLFKTLNCKGDNAEMAAKFIGGLGGLSIEDINKKIALFVQKGIIVLDTNKPVMDPGSFKVFQNSYEYLESQINKMESLEHLSAYKGRPDRINSKEAPDRLAYLIKNNEEFRNKDGKYLKLIFSKRLFEERYGKINFSNENLKDEYKKVMPEFSFDAPVAAEFSENDITDISKDPVLNIGVPSFDVVDSDKEINTKDVIDTTEVKEENIVLPENYTSSEETSDKVNQANVIPEVIPETSEVKEKNTVLPENYTVSEEASDNVNVIPETIPETSEVKEENKEEITVNEMNLEPTDMYAPKTPDTEVVSNNIVNDIEPVSETNTVLPETTVEEPAKVEEVTDRIIAPIVETEKKKKKKLEAFEEKKVYDNPIEEILDNPQTIGLTDETFERYERLADSIHHILFTVYGIEEVNDTVTDNLIKLVTNEIPDDKTVIYYSIVNNKKISEEEVKRLNAAIDDELEYTSILDIDLGRAA